MNMEITGIAEKMNPEILLQGMQKAANYSASAETQEVLTREIRKYIEGNREAVEALTEKLNQFIETMRYSLQFIPDKNGKEIVIKVYDSQGKLIRRIPPEAMSALEEHMGESIGLMLNQILE